MRLLLPVSQTQHCADVVARSVGQASDSTPCVQSNRGVRRSFPWNAEQSPIFRDPDGTGVFGRHDTAGTRWGWLCQDGDDLSDAVDGSACVAG